ncbi:MAG TPA: AraC family transcriptional regulator [Rhodanobacteraceae bacterium]|nr:AraC family transcriptional regulator [Rhodanobacteraceae bacterium]
MTTDLLSDVLALVRLTGALIFRADITAPWGIAGNPTLDKFAPLLPASTNNVIALHVVLSGECWIRCLTRDWIHLTCGRAVVISHGDRHDLCDRPGRETMPFPTLLRGRSLLDLRHAKIGTGPGAKVSLLCAFLGCDHRTFDPLCDSLPPVFEVDLGAHRDPLVRYAVANALDDSPGAAGLRSRLAELLYLSTLRRYMRDMPADTTGWLAGLRDPLVGRALQAIHAAPCRRWSVDELATTLASSRSVLAERFRTIIGEPPMHYLTRLRMQLAARSIEDSRCSIASVADQVGYDSSAAFQRAFKRCFGMPPAMWRQHVVGAQ